MTGARDPLAGVLLPGHLAMARGWAADGIPATRSTLTLAAQVTGDLLDALAGAWGLVGELVGDDVPWPYDGDAGGYPADLVGRVADAQEVAR